MPTANAESIWIPRWMMAPGFLSAPNPAVTEEEWAAWEKQQEPARKRAIEEGKKNCRDMALALQVIPFFGQAAAAAAYPVCVKSVEDGVNTTDRSIFGPVKVDPAYTAELGRGAPKVPQIPITDPTPEKWRAYKTAWEKHVRAYSLWKEQDLRQFVPDLTRGEWDALPDAEKRARAARIQRLAEVAVRIHEPKWLRVVLQDRARELLGQLQEWSAPTLIQRLGGIEYVALGVAALVAIGAAVAAALSSGRPRRLPR